MEEIITETVTTTTSSTLEKRAAVVHFTSCTCSIKSEKDGGQSSDE
jgi:hypothetical protein